MTRDWRPTVSHWSTPHTGPSATAAASTTPGCAEKSSVDDGGIDEGLELTAEVERARRDELGHEHDDQMFDGIDPERRRRRAAPEELPCRPDRLRADRSFADGDGEPEPHPVEPDLAVTARKRD